MTIDLVIPTYKPGEKLFESLRRLSRQTVPFGTIFLINTEKKYFPDHLTEQYPNVVVKHIKKEELITEPRGITELPFQMRRSLRL